MIERYRELILTKTPLVNKCICQYKPWYKQFEKNKEVTCRIKTIEKAFGHKMTRKSIITFLSKNADAISNFLAVMMWGHESDLNGRRDARGPWKVAQMTSDLASLGPLLDQTKERIKNGDVKEAYRCFKVARCGPNFFSKYFYFIGKSLNIARYPLIFDNRVAAGLVRITVSDGDLLDLVTIQSTRNVNAYLKYVNTLHKWAAELQCEADQIELFLFDYAAEQ